MMYNLKNSTRPLNNSESESYEYLVLEFCEELKTMIVEGWIAEKENYLKVLELFHSKVFRSSLNKPIEIRRLVYEKIVELSNHHKSFEVYVKTLKLIEEIRSKDETVIMKPKEVIYVELEEIQVLAFENRNLRLVSDINRLLRELQN